MATPVQLWAARKFMNLIKVTCGTCGKTFLKPVGQVNEAKKFGWKTYCSIVCQSKAKNKQQLLTCSNPRCKNTFKRKFSDIHSSNTYCSHSCAASVNNSKFPKRKAKIKKCIYCNKEFKGDGEKYCSRECKDKAQIISKKEILKQIKEFYLGNKRIPLKKEFPHYMAIRARFGTWNKAIIAAGLHPNPVRFAERQIAQDGHLCDSFAEKIIDDWLYSKNIEHQRNIPYPNNSCTADFQVKGKFIEFFGLAGELKEYDKNIGLKEKLAKKYKLKLIKIYPKDLFPVNHLSEIIRIK